MKEVIIFYEIQEIIKLKQSKAAHACNPIIWKTKTGESQV